MAALAFISGDHRRTIQRWEQLGASPGERGIYRAVEPAGLTPRLACHNCRTTIVTYLHARLQRARRV